MFRKITAYQRNPFLCLHIINHMPKIIEAVYEDGVFKPLEKVDLKEGERIRLKIEKRTLNFDPIDLGEPVSIEKIKELRDELWMSS